MFIGALFCARDFILLWDLIYFQPEELPPIFLEDLYPSNKFSQFLIFWDCLYFPFVSEKSFCYISDVRRITCAFSVWTWHPIAPWPLLILRLLLILRGFPWMWWIIFLLLPPTFSLYLWLSAFWRNYKQVWISSCLPTYCSLNLDVYINVFHQIWEVFSHYNFKYVSTFRTISLPLALTWDRQGSLNSNHIFLSSPFSFIPLVSTDFIFKFVVLSAIKHELSK